MPLPDKLERRLGAMHDNAREDAERQQAIECPPINPALIRHLEIMFSDPGKAAKPTNPLLGQLLTIQYGCDKVLNYLKGQYAAQSAAARRDRGI